MSRRDTIIIAVLLNAGLLIVLFATSLKTSNTESEPASVSLAAPSQAEHPQALVVQQPQNTDEVDQMIKQYQPPAIASQATETKPSFADDLQAIATGESPIPTTSVANQPQQQETHTEAAFKEVKVKKGDALEKIARANHVSVDEIMKANNLTTTRLKIGQVLKIPAKGAKKTAASASTGTETGAKYYTVKNGDNPWTIAVKNHIKVEDLLKLNNLDEERARRLKPGDQIRIK